jgi:hypothetical protein
MVIIYEREYTHLLKVHGSHKYYEIEIRIRRGNLLPGRTASIGSKYGSFIIEIDTHSLRMRSNTIVRMCCDAPIKVYTPAKGKQILSNCQVLTWWLNESIHTLCGCVEIIQ